MCEICEIALFIHLFKFVQKIQSEFDRVKGFIICVLESQRIYVREQNPGIQLEIPAYMNSPCKKCVSIDGKFRLFKTRSIWE